MGVEGTWNVIIHTPMGIYEAVVVLVDDDGVLSGSIEHPQLQAEIAGGSVDGNKLAWTTSVRQPVPATLDFKATVDGDDLSGSVKLGWFGTASFTGTRVV
jgi:hypothetical protein